MPRKKSTATVEDFEKNLARLEEIVGKMEKGDAKLAELMKDYAEGVDLAQKCRDALNAAEDAMNVVVGEDTDPQPLFIEE